jgi:hypothetical protein
MLTLAEMNFMSSVYFLARKQPQLILASVPSVVVDKMKRSKVNQIWSSAQSAAKEVSTNSHIKTVEGSG